MSSKNARPGAKPAARETDRKEPEAGETKTALLTPSSGDHDHSKNGSHAPSSATIAVEEYADGVTTPDDSVRTRKLAHIKQRVSQEFSHSTMCRKWLKWLIHLAALTLPYVAILIGAIYRNECPQSYMIPVYLIVAGVTASILHLSVSVDLYRKLSYTTGRRKPAIFTAVAIFLTIWTILGSVWTFSIIKPDYDYSTIYRPAYASYGSFYCNYTVYWFAFVFNILSLAALLGSWLLCCCVCPLLCHVSIATCLCHGDHDDDDDDGPVQV